MSFFIPIEIVTWRMFGTNEIKIDEAQGGKAGQIHLGMKQARKRHFWVHGKSNGKCMKRLKKGKLALCSKVAYPLKNDERRMG